MKLDRFWVVTIPTPTSTLADVCFETDIVAMERQFKGGLAATDIVGAFTDYPDAEEEAQRQLRAVSKAKSRDGFGGRLSDLLWDAITEQRLRDRAKALLDEILARE